MLRIPPTDISVVIQGPLYLQRGAVCTVWDCVESIKRHLPGAEIVVSTWRSEPDVDIPGVTTVRSTPMPPLIDVDGIPINTPRQRLTTLRGLEASTRRFVLKFRADHRLVNARIAQLGAFEDGTLSQHRLFMAPITTTNMFFRDPCSIPMLFHPSDLVQFGRREDLSAFWSAPPIDVEEYFLDRPTANPFGNCIRPTTRRYVPEQELMIAFMRTRGYDVCLNGICHITPKLMRLSESVLLTNFVILNWQDAGVEFPHRLEQRARKHDRDYAVACVCEIKDLLASQRYTLRIMKAAFNKYILSMFSKRWWRRARDMILLRCPTKLTSRRTKNFKAYGLDPSDITNLNSPKWRRAKWPAKEAGPS